MNNRILLILSLIFICCHAHSQQAERHILLEEFSTAPCGFCPDGDLIAEQIVRDHPTVIWVTHHAGFGTDSLTIPESVTIARAFTDFAPGACIDRGDYPIPIYTRPPLIAVSRQKWDSVITAHLHDPIPVRLSITRSFEPTSRTLDCTIGMEFLLSVAPGDIRLNLFIVEDSVIGYGKGYDQTNYYNNTRGHPCFQRGDPIVGYAHRRVLRSAPAGAWGLSGVIPNPPETGKPYTHTFSGIAIPDTWDAQALDLVAFVSYYNSDAKLRQIIHSASSRMIDAPVGMERIPAVAAVREMEIVPNPAGGKIEIRYGNGRMGGRIFITDRVGRLMWSTHVDEGDRSTIVSVASLPEGIYFCRFEDLGGNSFNGRFVVLR